MKQLTLFLVIVFVFSHQNIRASGDEGDDKVEIKHYTQDMRLMNMHYRRYLLLDAQINYRDRKMSKDKLNRTGNALLYTGIAATVIGTIMMANADELYYNYNSNTGSEGDAGGAFGVLIAAHGIAGIIVGGILKGRANRRPE